MSNITELFNQYGYIVLYVALTLELIALPTPGETLMIYCGYLVYQGQLNWLFSIITAAAGVITGITISFCIGTVLENKFIIKYGSYIHMNMEKMEQVSKWFRRYGNGLLIISCFIPGIRHITGYFAGITKIPYKKFAINSYIGAFIWPSVFITLGKVLGPSWEQFHASLKKYLIIGGVTAGIILICIYLYKSYKEQITEYVNKKLEYALKIFHSLGKLRIAVVIIALIFVGLTILSAGLVQDFLANEYVKFDTMTSYIIDRIFVNEWSDMFHFISYLTSFPVLIFIVLFITAWIIKKGKNRILELRFLISIMLGGEILEELLRAVFHRLGPLESAVPGYMKYTFPSEQAFMSVITYGLAAFIIARHINRHWIASLMIIMTLVICILSGISPVFLKQQYPSDITAGYVFGGVWLSINILLLEVFRIIPEIEKMD